MALDGGKRVEVGHIVAHEDRRELATKCESDARDR